MANGPTPGEAVVILRAWALGPSSTLEAGNAIAVLLDHVMKLEQMIDLLDAGHQSALRHRPDNACYQPKQFSPRKPKR